MELMNKYPEIQGYCDYVLYSTKECWAHAFTKQKFLANTHSTQHVESINHVIKLEANSGNSLYQPQSNIELQLKDEAKYTRLQEFWNMNLTASLPNVSNMIFKSIDDMCKKYLTQNLLALQRKQILERQEINNRDAIKSNSKKATYSHSLGLCKKTLNIAMMSSSNGVLEEFMISNPIQYKGKGCPSSKRYLSAIENYNTKNACSNNQNET
ncbi:16968_t:CDS:2, partial [Racocetra persica]